MRSSIKEYALGIVALVAAVLLRWLLDPLMEDSLPLVTLFGAVAAAVWLGGYRLAIVVAILGYLACDFLFIQPRGQLGLNEFGNVVGLAAYLFTCFLIIGFGQAMRAAQLRASERREVLSVTLRSIGDAVITTDTDGHITYLNTVGESLTGWLHTDALGQPLESVFRIVNETTRLPVENPAMRALRDGVVVGLANHTVLIKKDGSECEGQGSEFVVRLPILSKTTDQLTSRQSVAAETAPARRILIVDDNRDAADSLAMLLEITGNKTFMAHDGLDALEAVEKHRPDVVLLDIGLPRLHGHDVCRRVREQSWGRDIVVIALTGWGQEEDRRKSEEAGFNGHLVKPVNYDELLQLLSSLTNGA